MENRPEYAVTFFAAAKLGVVLAYLNTNLRLKALQHCIAVSTAKVLLFGTELASAVHDISDALLAQGGACAFTGTTARWDRRGGAGGAPPPPPLCPRS